MNASIKDFAQKIKVFGKLFENKDFFTALIIILISFLSFGLGRISEIQKIKTPVRIENTENSIKASDLRGTINKLNGVYVASRYGKTYHFLWCPGADRIKKENKILFESKSEAEKAGYKPAKNCRGL